MNRRWTWVVLAGVGLASAVALTVLAKEKGAGEQAGKEDADEQKVALEQVPAPAREVLTKLAGGAKIDEVTKESENGTEVFEGKWTANGKVREASVAADGSLLQMEESLTANDLPASVKAALDKQMADAENVSYVKKTITLYEAEGQVNGKKREATVSPAGASVELEEKHGKQEKDEEEDDD